MKSVILFLGVIGLATQTHAQDPEMNDCYIVQNAYYYNSEEFTCGTSVYGETLRKMGTYEVTDNVDFISKCCRETHSTATGNIVMNNAGGQLKECSVSETFSYEGGYQAQISGNNGCSISGRDDSDPDYYVLGLTADNTLSNFVMACCNEPTVCITSENACENSSPTGSYEIYDETNFQETCCVTTCETSGNTNTCSENSFPTLSTEIYDETNFQETCCVPKKGCSFAKNDYNYDCPIGKTLTEGNGESSGSVFADGIESGNNGFVENCCCEEGIVGDNIQYVADDPIYFTNYGFKTCKSIALADLVSIKTNNEAATPSGECLSLTEDEKNSIQRIINDNTEQFNSDCSLV